MKEVLNRLKSPVVLCEIVLLATTLLRTLGIYDMPNETLASLQDLITIAYSVFASLNNPTERENF